MEVPMRKVIALLIISLLVTINAWGQLGSTVMIEEAGTWAGGGDVSDELNNATAALTSDNATVILTFEDVSDVSEGRILYYSEGTSSWEFVEPYKKEEKPMFVSIFSWLGLFLFWGVYFGLSVVLGTIMMRRCAPYFYECVIKKDPKNAKEKYTDTDIKIFSFILPFFYYALWIIPAVVIGSFLLVKWVILKPFLLAARFADKTIPKIRIVRDQD
jgi:hypothetical protein